MSTRFSAGQVDYIVQLNLMDDATAVTNDVVNSATIYPVFSTNGAGTGFLRCATTKMSFVPLTGILSVNAIKTTAYTVATLPAASGNQGLRAQVTDSTVAASGNFGATVVGGGANVVPVFSNGTAWIIA